MKWFEYIIMIVAIGLVFLPFILKIVNKKKPSFSLCDALVIINLLIIN